jgi:hypothetical protein
MARRRRSEVEVAAQDEKALERRLTGLGRGATAYLTMDLGSTAYGSERAAWEAISAADDERLSIRHRVEAREDLLARMGRLDRVLRHVRSMELARERWARR